MSPNKPPPRASKIGQTSIGDRGVATAPEPSINVSDSRPSATTYFTKVPVIGEQSSILYPADRLWARVILTLETAGPVAVGFKSQISPVLSGRGQLLQTGVATVFDVPKGNPLYIAATAVNRVKLTVESLPWLELIAALLGRISGGFLNKVLGRK